ncbi:hypothetical protein BDW02DRAFT_571215 [Decorospora gaudefroyi]|uniref:Zn(2)-C6 fungal-type domain-containing protein n=1 Tax=Decorospora gaudefroyi TaxID=184978 RepID=A0A6A5K8C3_9PLEO|nr:hypothetical protein BDW02DRAFT_571215 [Decorospora gaudefroyi]
MVGVAGKSRACADCRRRRVKCDFRRPSCLRCEKAKLSCQGYDKTQVFVNRTLTKRSTTALAAISEAKLREPPAVSLEPSTWYQAFQRLSLSISDPSFRTQAWTVLRELYLPRATSTDTEAEATTAYSWLKAACELGERSYVLDQSLLAFCAIQIHIAEPWNISVNTALRLYSESLPKLVRSIEDPHEQGKNETLAAIVALSTCELFILPTDEGWRAHAHGICELLRHRTSFNDVSSVWLRLCSRLRIICVRLNATGLTPPNNALQLIIGLTKRKRLALDLPVWHQLMNIDYAPESLGGLLDVISPVPKLLEESDNAIESGTKDPDLLRSLVDIFKRIEAWQYAYKLSLPGQPYWATPARLHNPSDDSYTNCLFPFALDFENMDVAINYTFSAAVMLQILSAALLLGRQTCDAASRHEACQYASQEQDFGTHREQCSLPSIQNEADRLARFLCQSVEYCFRSEMGTLGAQITCLPLWAMGNYFRQAGLQRELQWCKKIKDMKGPSMRQRVNLMLLGSEGSWWQ